MENFLRDTTPENDLDGQDIICQITNMHGENWAEDDEEEYPKKIYKIIIFGVTENSETVGITVNGFYPFFYVCIPDNKQEKWNKQDTKYFEAYIRKRMKFFNWALKDVELVIKKKLFPFTNFEEFKFIKLTFRNTIAFHVVKKYFYDPIKILDIRQKELNFELYECNVDPLTRFTQCADILTAGWIKINAGQFLLNEEPITTSQFDISVSFDVSGKQKPISHMEINAIAPIVIASFDIETFSADACYKGQSVFPNSSNEEDTVAQIGTTLWKYGTDQVLKHIVTLSDHDQDGAPEVPSDFIIEIVKTEKELYSKWASFISKTNPDGYTGYNIFGYDWKYLSERPYRPILAKMSRIIDIPGKMKHSELKSSAYGVNTFDILEIPGCFQIDLYTQIRREHKLESYKLDNVAFHFTKQRKDDMPYMELFKKLKGTPQDIYQCAKYCVQDTYLVIQLIRQLKIVTNLIEMAKVTRVPIDWLITRGQQIKVFNQIAYSCDKKNICVPFFKRNDSVQEKYVGATVLNADIGAYMTQAVAGLDFASLYPSIMIAHKLCYSTYISNEPKYEKYKNIEGIDYEVLEWQEENGTKFKYTFVQNTDSVLPDLLDTLWKCRKEAKKQMKNAKDENEKAVYNGKQLAIKVTMNSIYGFTGADVGMLPLKAIAASTTTWGRKAIEHSKSLVEEAYDATVCYGDSIPGWEKVNIRTEEEEHFTLPIQDIIGFANGAAKWKPYENFKPGEPGRFSKEQLILPNPLCTWTSSGWKPIRRVIRHKTKKKLYRITTKQGSVVVTEDHSLLTENKEPIKPSQLQIGTKLLHHPIPV